MALQEKPKKAAEVTGQAKPEAAERVESPVRHGSPCGFFGGKRGKTIDRSFQIIIDHYSTSMY